MFPFDFFSHPMNTELATLLIASPFTEEEKRAWIITMPLMTDDEKKELRANLLAEIRDFSEIESQSINMLEHKIAKLLSQSSI